MTHVSQRARTLTALAALLSLAACGGGNSDGPVEPPPPKQFTVSGTVVGLVGSGLVLALNGGSDLPVAAGSSSFAFTGTMTENIGWLATVKTQPTSPSQTCIASRNNGLATANVTDMLVTCTTNGYAVGGTITGLTGTGLTLMLNGATPLTVAAGASGFAFQNVLSGTSYAVSISAQPVASSGGQPQTCSVGNASGVVTASSVANVVVTCVNAGYTIGGTITGLSGSGLVLQYNGANDLTVNAGATSFSFAGTVTAGSAYAVTVKTQPSAPSQTCTAANPTGTATANVSIAITCVSNSLTIGGSISGLTGAGATLLLNGITSLSVAAGSTNFTFPTTVAAGQSYAVTVFTQPTSPSQSCTVSNGSGTVGASGVTNVAITCSNNAANTWTVGGTINGLTASGLVLLLNGTTSLVVPSGATTFAFPAIANSSSYQVSIGTQPTNRTCTLSNTGGTVSGANVTNVAVNCQLASYTISVSISGYLGTGLRLFLNGTTRVIAAGTTTYTFPTFVQSGATYAVTVDQQPSAPNQSCVVTNGTGTVGAADVTNISVSCVNVFTIGGLINNQNGGGLVLLLNGGSALTRNFDNTGSFTFAGLPTGAPYSVTIGAQPTAPSQTCTLVNGNGTIGTGNVNDIVVTCVNAGPVIGGTISGYTGSGLKLRINGGAPFTPQTRTKWVFAENYAPLSQFNVTVSSQPTDPSQTCTLTRGIGSVPPAGTPNNVQNILVQCITNATAPLVGTYSVLINGRRNFLTLWADGTYVYATRRDDAACGNGAGNGVEYGAYSWNATTGAFSILNAALDSNGPCGMWNSSASPMIGVTGTLTKAGSTLTLVTSTGTLVFTAVTSTPGALVGAFQSAGDANGGILVFLPDNTYLAVTTQINPLSGDGRRLGYERGCITVTASTLSFSLASTCQPDGFPALDLDGSAGASDGSLNVPIPYAFTSANVVSLGGDQTFVRLIAN